MFYKQSVLNVKMVIVYLDDGLLSLNNLRYKYIHNICQDNNITLTKDMFVDSIRDYKTLYASINSRLSKEDFRNIVESDLYKYVKIKPSVVNSGVEEFLRFLDVKKIKVAVVTSFKAKRAVQYLQLLNIYQYVDFVIGGDSNLSIETGELFNKIATANAIPACDMLVVGNYKHMVEGANASKMPVVYVPGLINDESLNGVKVYQHAKNYLDLINVLLFAKYDDLEMYSKVLGFTKFMTKEQLDRRYKLLVKQYQEDEDLLVVVERAYSHYCSNIENIPVVKKEVPVERPTIKEKEEVSVEMPTSVVKEDELVEIPTSMIKKEAPSKSIVESKVQGSSLLDSITPMQIAKQTSNKVEIIEEDIVDSDVDEILVSDTNEETVEKTTSLPDSFKDNAREISDIMSKIDGDEKQSATLINRKADIEIYNDHDEPFFEVLFNAMFNAVLIVLISIILNLAFSDYIMNNKIINIIVKYTVGLYVQLVEFVFSTIFNLLHMVFVFIPSYEALMTPGGFLSPLAVTILFVITFTTIVLVVQRRILLRIKEHRRN